MQVGGMNLPAALVAAISDGRWHPPVEVGVLAEIFASEVVDPRFYSLEGIVSETERWHAERDAETLALYLGKADHEFPPGDIVQHRSVFIGDLGPDMPFALDYRDWGRPPTIIFLTIPGDWRQISPNVETFLRSLGLSGAE